MEVNSRVFGVGLLVIFIVFIGTSLYAQGISASPYSVYGIGVLRDRTSGLNRSIGGTGIGIRDPLHLNNLNPASYTSIQTITQIFEVGLFVESDYYETSKESGRSSTGNLTSINSWFRFSKKWAGNFGLTPFSNVDYSISSNYALGEAEGSTVQYSGTGGISQFYIGNGYQLTKNLSVGVNLSYLFGSIQKKETIDSGIGAGTGITKKTNVNRINADYGAQYTFFLKKNRSLSLGVTFDERLKLNTSGDIIVSESFEEDTLWSESTKIDDFVLPMKIGGGISYQTRRSTISADVTFSEWSRAKLEEGIRLRNTLRYSIGYEYNGDDESDIYWKNIQLRSGVYLQDNYLILNKSTFVDWGFSLGLGLPFNGNRGLVNFSYNYNQSGTTSNGLIRQQANVFVLDFTFRDLWGIRRKFD